MLLLCTVQTFKHVFQGKWGTCLFDPFVSLPPIISQRFQCSSIHGYQNDLFYVKRNHYINLGLESVGLGYYP